MHGYHNFAAPEAMDAAQVARNISEGKGFTTEFIRPFSAVSACKSTTSRNKSERDAWHQRARTLRNDPNASPDLANAPVYPLVLAGLMKVLPSDWKVNTAENISGAKAGVSCATSRNFSSPFSTRFYCWWSCRADFSHRPKNF